MDTTSFLKAVEATSIAGWIRDSLYAFPLIESFHVIGLTLVFGTIAIIDLRLLGLASRHRPFTRVASDVFKWTWVAFALTVATGLLMFITNANVYFSNRAFRWKMAMLAASGINMLIFERTSGRNVRAWDTDPAAPTSGRLAAILSLVLWISVIFLGRWIGFTITGSAVPAEEINLDDLFK